MKRNLLLDSINTITIAKIKQAVFAMALTLKKGIFELLIDKSSNLVMPKTCLYEKNYLRSIPTINAPKQTSKFSVVSNDNILWFFYILIMRKHQVLLFDDVKRNGWNMTYKKQQKPLGIQKLRYTSFQPARYQISFSSIIVFIENEVNAKRQ